MVIMKLKNCLLILFLIAAVSSDARIRRDVATSNAPQYEYISPKDMSEIADEELKGILSQQKGNWVLTMKKGVGKVSSDIYLNMAAGQSLEFALDVGSEAYPQTNDALLNFSLVHPSGTSKNLIVAVMLDMDVEVKIKTPSEKYKLIGTAKASIPEHVKIKINHDGSIEGNFDKYQSHMSLAGAGVFVMNPLSWSGLPRDFKFLIPSSVFRVRRLVPATTPLDSFVTGNGTSNTNKAEFIPTIVYIVIGFVAFVAVCSVAGIIVCWKLEKGCFKKSSSKTPPTKSNTPDTPEAVKTAEPFKTGDVTGTSKKIKEAPPVVPPANPTAVVAVPPTSPAAVTVPAPSPAPTNALVAASNPQNKQEDQYQPLGALASNPTPANQSAPANGKSPAPTNAPVGASNPQVKRDDQYHDLADFASKPTPANQML